MPQNDKALGMGKFHGITAGTVTASKALVVDANKDLSSIRNLGLSGTLTTVTSNSTTSTSTTANVTNLVFGVGGKIDTDSGTTTATGSGTVSSGTLNKMAGKVTTPAMTSAALSGHVCTISNSQITSADMVLVSISSTTTGFPVLASATISTGTVVVTIYNASSTTAFNAAADISFLVLKA